MYIKEITNKEELTRYIEKNTEKLFRYFIKYLKSADWLRAIILEQIGASEVEALNFNIEYEEQKEDIIYSKVDRPSYRVSPGQRIRLNPSIAKKKLFVIENAITRAERLEYIHFDKDSLSGSFTTVPTVAEIPVQVEIAKIIEFSSRRM